MHPWFWNEERRFKRKPKTENTRTHKSILRYTRAWCGTTVSLDIFGGSCSNQMNGWCCYFVDNCSVVLIIPTNKKNQLNAIAIWYKWMLKGIFEWEHDTQQTTTVAYTRGTKLGPSETKVIFWSKNLDKIHMHNITPGAEKIASHTKRKNLTGQPKELDGLTNKKKVAVHAKNGTTHTHRRAEKKT